MIRRVQGDILLTKAQALAHGVAPNDHFDHGLALALRERWPAMVKDFRHWCRVASPKPGTLWTWAGPGGVRIVNLLTQEPAPTKNAKPLPATLQHVGHALHALAKEVAEQGFESIALPKLATGVGGLDWGDVLPLIEKHLGDVGATVVVYDEFHAGVQADERLGAVGAR